MGAPADPAPAPASPSISKDAEAPATVAESPEDECTRTLPRSWQTVTTADIDRCIDFKALRPDGSVYTPIAPLSQEPDPDVLDTLETIRRQLPQWAPGRVPDPVQRVRNLLYVAAVPDVLQIPVESYVPLIVFSEIQRAVPKDDLVKILLWIGVHWDQGSDAAVNDLRSFGIARVGDVEEVRGRAAAYGVKLLGQITGRRPFRP